MPRGAPKWLRRAHSLLTRTHHHVHPSSPITRGNNWGTTTTHSQQHTPMWQAGVGREVGQEKFVQQHAAGARQCSLEMHQPRACDSATAIGPSAASHFPHHRGARLRTPSEPKYKRQVECLSDPCPWQSIPEQWTAAYSALALRRRISPLRRREMPKDLAFLLPFAVRLSPAESGACALRVNQHVVPWFSVVAL